MAELTWLGAFCPPPVQYSGSPVPVQNRIKLIVNILDLIHFGNTLENKQERSCTSLEVIFLNIFFISFISSSRFSSNWVFISASILQSTLDNLLITLRCNSWRTWSSHSSISLLLNSLDKLVSNTDIADVTISINFVTFVSFFWYFW